MHGISQKMHEFLVITFYKKICADTPDKKESIKHKIVKKGNNLTTVLFFEKKVSVENVSQKICNYPKNKISFMKILNLINTTLYL